MEESPLCRMVVPAILTHNSFEYFLNQLPPEEKLKRNHVVLDFSLTSTISPYTISCFLVLCRYLEKIKVDYTLDFSTNRVPLIRFNSWDFFTHLKKGNFKHPSSQTKGDEPGDNDIFMPFHTINDEKDIYKVLGYLRENFDIPDGAATDLFVVVSEITQNIIEHSGSTGFVGMQRRTQRHRQKPIIDILVVDDGAGIGKTLEDKLTFLERSYRDGAAIYKVLFKGISRYDDVGRGYGIVKTREIVEKHKGKMLVRSGQAKLWGKIPSWEIERFLQKKLRYLPGTQINILFPL